MRKRHKCLSSKHLYIILMAFGTVTYFSYFSVRPLIEE